MTKILIIDKDHQAREALAEALKGYDAFTVLSCEQTALAAELIKIRAVDVLISEVGLREMEGLKLLSHVRKRFPDTLTIAMASLFPDTLVRELNTLGIHAHLKKPVAVDTLVDLITENTGHSHPSTINGVSLASFLQLMNLEQKTCTLTVQAHENQGKIYFLKGEIISARTSDMAGYKAIHRIMKWEMPEICLTEGCPDIKRDIHHPLMHLLMESHQQLDESLISIPEKEKQTSGSQSRQDLNKLAQALASMPRVLDYEICDTARVLRAPLGPGNGFKASAGEFLTTANTLGRLLGSPLKYATLRRPDRTGYWAGTLNQYFVRATLRPGANGDGPIGHWDSIREAP